MVMLDTVSLDRLGSIPSLAGATNLISIAVCCWMNMPPRMGIHNTVHSTYNYTVYIARTQPALLLAELVGQGRVHHSRYLYVSYRILPTYLPIY